MANVSQTLREEHSKFLPSVEEIRSAADLVGDAPVAIVHRQIDKVYRFLTHHLLPYTHAEERALYPAIGRVSNSSEAIAMLIHDHLEIGRFTDRLGLLRLQLAETSLNPVRTKELREVLYGLYTLIRVHFAKKEEIISPLLEARLTRAEIQDIFEAMQKAVREAQLRPLQ